MLGQSDVWFVRLSGTRNPCHIPLMRFPALVLTFGLAACGGMGKGTSAPTPAEAVAAATITTVNATAPTTFVRSTAESQVTRSIDVRDGITKVQAMRSLVDALSQRYTVEVQDPRAGFAMTAWEASLLRDGVPDLRYRTRLTARFLGDDWKKLQLRHEANWARGDEWDVGFDVAQLDSVTTALRSRIGKKITP
ncbi:MAG: hypothetical protein JWL61_1642 [Gemmatimonadetes bacterium]|jgi:hypothetical protein|nr:hypothetical protein [Gemmatimonadota bacterium]